MDISDQTQAAILDALPAHIALLDPRGCIMVVNEGWRHFGAANGLKCGNSCVGDNYLEVCGRAQSQSPEACKVVKGIGQILLGEISSFALEYPCHSPTERRWFRLQVTPLGGNGHSGAVVMHLNITEQKIAEDQIARQQLMLSSAVRIAGVGVWERNIPNDRLDWAVETFQCFGTSREDFGGTYADFLALVHPADRQAVKESNDRAQATGETIDVEYRIILPNGEIRTLHDRSAISFDESGQPLSCTGAVIDATLRKRYESDLMRAKQTAEAASQAKSEFLANMSHELRTPMNAIIGMIDLVLDTDLTSEQREQLTVATSSANALMDILDSILNLSKIEAGKLDLDLTDFNLQELIEGVGKTLATRAHEKGLELTCELEPDVPEWVAGDPTRLRQVIVNLMGNAIKFTPSGEVGLRVAVASSTAESVVLQFAVRDTGIGVPPEKAKLIFEAFSQADNSVTRKFGGTGLGLTISSRLVDLMGGRIWVESKPAQAESNGQGFTQFHFTAQLRVVATSASAKWAPTLLAELAGMPVLIVDDNATNRRILGQTISRWGLDPMYAESGADALTLLTQRHLYEARPLILCDVHMPEMDGFTLAIKIQAAYAPTGTTIIMLTSGGLLGDAARARNRGIAGYVAKPVSRGELLATILRAVRPVAPEVPAPAVLPSETAFKRKFDVLVAEDQLPNQKLMKTLLERNGYEVTIVSNGREALTALEARRFDAVLMDVQMPVMDGLQATAVVREKERSTGEHLPIIALTAGAMLGDPERCLAGGMDAYISKPVRRRDLLNALALHLRAVVSE